MILNVLSVPTHSGDISNLIMVVPLRVDACDLPLSCVPHGDSDGYSFPFCELLLSSLGPLLAPDTTSQSGTSCVLPFEFFSPMLSLLLPTSRTSPVIFSYDFSFLWLTRE